MKKSKSIKLIVICSVLLSACQDPVPQSGVASPPVPTSTSPTLLEVTQPVPDATQPSATQTAPAVQINVEHHSDVDITHLELGDGKVSSGPQMGYVYSCITAFDSTGGGAGSPGNWLNGDGTWDLTRKQVVDGSIIWPHSFTISLQGDQRIFQGNDLPDHPTGIFPIASTDDAYSADRNPNSIQSQNITLSLPALPTAVARPNCVAGEVGILLSGVVIFSAFDAEGRDAPAHEVQDGCNGHPQNTGFYHYHSLSNCIQDTASGHSALMGYAFDGYGIYGYYGEDGRELTNADLDECHGHIHMIEWNGQMVEMYHYHATHEFPYIVGCFHGTAAIRALSAGGGQGGEQGQQGGGQGPAQGGGGQPPQQAIDACNGLAQGAACTINTPNGTINGTCNTPPNSSQLACMPQGGPPGP